MNTRGVTGVGASIEGSACCQVMSATCDAGREAHVTAWVDAIGVARLTGLTLVSALLVDLGNFLLQQWVRAHLVIEAGAPEGGDPQVWNKRFLTLRLPALVRRALGVPPVVLRVHLAMKRGVQVVHPSRGAAEPAIPSAALGVGPCAVASSLGSDCRMKTNSCSQLTLVVFIAGW